MNILSNMSSTLNFACENSQSTNAAIADDFLGEGEGGGGCMMTVKSHKSAKRRVFSKAPHVCVHLHDLSAQQNSLGNITCIIRSEVICAYE